MTDIEQRVPVVVPLAQQVAITVGRAAATGAATVVVGVAIVWSGLSPTKGTR